MRFPTLLFLALTCLFYGNSSAQQPGAGYSLNFDGTNDFVNGNAADLTGYTNSFTIEFWVEASATRTTKTEATSGITGTTGHGQRYAVFPSHGGASNGGVGVSVGTNGVSVYEHGSGYMPALLVWDGTLTGWNHIAVVYTAKQPSLYINGILVRTGLTSVRTAVYPSARLGGHTYGWYSGDIDEFRIWSTSRTQAQIRDNMCKKLLGSETGLERYYRVDNGTGTTVTDVTGTRNGTMTNMAPASDWVTSGASIGNTSTHDYASAWSGTALDFDGTNDYVNGYAADLQAVTDNFTMEMWVNPTGTHTVRAQATSGITGTTGQRYACYPQHGGASPGIAGAGVSVGTNGVQVFEHAASYLPCLASYSTTISGWTHIAVVYTSKQPTIYINGVAVHTGLTSARTAVFPGAHVGGIIYGFFLGQIDDYRVWNHSRTANQIASNMCAELTGSETGLIRYYNFNDGSGGTATDGTGTRNGTLTNMNTVTDWVTTGAGACVSGSLVHASPENDSLGVSSIAGFTQGFHIYHVEAVPNSTTGVAGLGGNDHYYGVFKAGVNTPTTYTATYYYNDNDAYQASNITLNENDLALYNRSDNTVTTWSNTLAAQNTTANTLTATAQSTEFILGATGGVALPVDLLTFTAHTEDNVTVDLGWQTASEVNNDYFTVERSTDGRNWHEVAQVDGKGNSRTVQSYNSKDLQPHQGVNYYRLKQTDHDGKFKYADIVPVNIGEAPAMSIYPNPTRDILVVSGDEFDISNLQVMNSIGQSVTDQVQLKKLGLGKTMVDLSELSSGLYLIRSKTHTSKVYKQ